MKEKQPCNIHVMPPTISDADITALFNGILSVMKRKVELDTRAEIINSNLSIAQLQRQLKEKCAECNRLKNEIIFLKAQLAQK